MPVVLVLSDQALAILDQCVLRAEISRQYTNMLVQECQENSIRTELEFSEIERRIKDNSVAENTKTTEE